MVCTPKIEAVGHLRFFAVNRMEPTWCCSISVRIWGVTSVPSHPIISICPMALSESRALAIYTAIYTAALHLAMPNAMSRMALQFHSQASIGVKRRKRVK